MDSVRIDQVNIEFAIILAASQPGVALGKAIFKSVVRPPGHTGNTSTNGFNFRGGKQNKRDAIFKDGIIDIIKEIKEGMLQKMN